MAQVPPLGGVRPAAAPALALAMFAAAAVVAPRIDAAAASPQGPRDPLTRLMGSAKEAVGDQFFLKADAIYHGGVEDEFEHSADDHEKEGRLDGHAREAEPQDWIARLNRALRVHDHYHLQGDERKEILPYLAVAMRLDPYNPEGVLATSYWLERMSLNEQAMSVLERGVRDNPDSWEIEFRYVQRLARRGGAAPEVLLAHFDEALRKSASADIHRSYRAAMLSARADALAALGRREEALKSCRDALALYGAGENVPLKAALRKKIAALESSAAL